eukprot:TRINITY_DN2314_c0_g1_i1.p1 TRINITY_DN2314_c0_g1~~TRINITY_DN2314_c0_g1_i1.p1  ORF type:complete len:177 (+),score=59.94 TRINITY_DN2314_c0_g1_i1:129-659(+)
MSFDPKQVLARLDAELNKYPQLKQVEKAVGVPKAYLAIGVFAFLILSCLFNLGAKLLTNLIGFVFPAYSSFKALESPSKEDDTQWLTYWVSFSVFHIVEVFSDTLLFWFPYYYVAKMALLLWLQYFQGASILYTKVLRPLLFKPNENKIDQKVAELSAEAQKKVQEIKDEVEKKLN